MEFGEGLLTQRIIFKKVVWTINENDFIRMSYSWWRLIYRNNRSTVAGLILVIFPSCHCARYILGFQEYLVVKSIWACCLWIQAKIVVVCWDLLILQESLQPQLAAKLPTSQNQQSFYDYLERAVHDSSSSGRYSSRSPGWQSRYRQMLSSVENRTALALFVFKIDRFGKEMSIASASSESFTPRLINIKSRFTRIAICTSNGQRAFVF